MCVIRTWIYLSIQNNFMIESALERWDHKDEISYFYMKEILEVKVEILYHIWSITHELSRVWRQ